MTDAISYREVGDDTPIAFGMARAGLAWRVTSTFWPGRVVDHGRGLYSYVPTREEVRYPGICFVTLDADGLSEPVTLEIQITPTAPIYFTTKPVECRCGGHPRSHDRTRGCPVHGRRP